MIDIYTTFRRVEKDRTRGCVVVEVSPRSVHYLPGAYDVDRLAQKVIDARFVNLKHWRPYPPKAPSQEKIDV